MSAIRFLVDKREMYAKFLASHIDFCDALMLSQTTEALPSAQERLSADSEVARQVIILVAPHMEADLAEVYNEFKSAAAAKYALLHSRDHKIEDPYFAR